MISTGFYSLDSMHNSSRSTRIYISDQSVYYFPNQSARRCSDECLQRIYGGCKCASTKAIRHLSGLPTTKEQIDVLEAQFLLIFYATWRCSLNKTYAAHTTRQKSTMIQTVQVLTWKSIPPPVEELSIKAIKKQFLQQDLDYQKHKTSKLLSYCRQTVSLIPIPWVSMTWKEHSRCIRWRLG